MESSKELSPAPLASHPGSPSGSDASDAVPVVPLPPPATSPKEAAAKPKSGNVHVEIPKPSSERPTKKRRRDGEISKKKKPQPLPSYTHLPSNPLYQRSYMHRTVVTHVLITATTVISASEDGRISFWHRDIPHGQQSQANETKDSASCAEPKSTLTFIKSFQAHRGALSAMHLTQRQDTLLTTSTSDKSLKVFSVNTFDMTQFTTLKFLPADSISSVQAPERVIIPFRDRALIAVLLLSDVSARPCFINLSNTTQLTHIVHNAAFQALITCDSSSILDYALVPNHQPLVVLPDAEDDDNSEHIENDNDDNRTFGNKENQSLSHDVPHVTFQTRLRTDLYTLVKAKTELTSICVSPQGTLFATTSMDLRIRIFDFVTAKVWRVYDESQTQLNMVPNIITSQQLARRLARNSRVTEDKATLKRGNVAWDETGMFILFATVLGVKMVHVESNRVANVLGLRESAVRLIHVAVAHGDVRQGGVYDENGGAERGPLMVATAFDNERIFLFGCGSEVVETNRDVYNERRIQRQQGLEDSGSKLEDGELGGEEESPKTDGLPRRCTLHTSVGDVAIQLLPESASRAVENFVTHAQNGYFNGVLFHRIVKGFMVQTGDPDGDGTGGGSIWGGSFDDEIDSDLTHEVGTVSMANAGPNTNGSQFFIVTGKAGHLDKKHTIFGKVTKGMGVIRQIEGAKTNKFDRPLDVMTIESVSVHAYAPSTQ